MNETVYLAVDKQGNEYMYDYPPHRGKQHIDACLETQRLVYNQEEADSWYPRVFRINDNGFVDYCDEMLLPKGSIFKLTGRNITWDDGYIIYRNE